MVRRSGGSPRTSEMDAVFAVPFIHAGQSKAAIALYF